MTEDEDITITQYIILKNINEVFERLSCNNMYFTYNHEDNSITFQSAEHYESDEAELLGFHFYGYTKTYRFYLGDDQIEEFVGMFFDFYRDAIKEAITKRLNKVTKELSDIIWVKKLKN